jgi:hypothetical protein
MRLHEFERYFESFSKTKIFKRGISEPFTWRGDYSQVAFAVTEESMTTEDILANIRRAYTEKFIGYKGGEYRFYKSTEVNFEDNYGAYTEGAYAAQWIANLEGTERPMSQEERLLSLCFDN